MSTAAVQAVGTHLEDRARRAATDLEAHRQLEAAKVELRDRLVVDLIDTGHTVAETARIALVSKARVMQILAKAG